jgi:anti-sigma factor RsiW
MNKHEQIEKLLTGYALGELSQEQSSQVRTHLSKCHHCSSQVKNLQAVIESAGQMGELSADEETFESARDALFAAIASEQKEPTPRPKPGLESIWRTTMKNRITKLAAAAVIIIAVFLGLDVIVGPSTAGVAYAFLSIVEQH